VAGFPPKRYAFAEKKGNNGVPRVSF